MSENFWDKIPRGKNDAPTLFWDLSKPLPYDFNDPDSQYVMFSRELEGCVTLPFTKPMEPVPGKASVGGQEIPCIIAPVKLAGFDSWWLGIKLGGCLHEYGKTVTVRVSGFRDTDGNEMLPTDIRVETAPKAEPNPRYAAHEQIALQAAQDGIVLMKNENGVLPLNEGEALNFFGRGLMEYRICAVGAGKIFPRYAVGLLEAARNEKTMRVNEELVSFYACGENKIPDTNILYRAKGQSETAIMVISRASGENTDNSSGGGEYCLTNDEENLLAALRQSFGRLVVILNVGYPINVSFAERYGVDALVYGGFGGMLAGQAMMDILTGRVNPSGKLPDTWACSYDSIPAAKNFYDCAGGKKRIVTDDGEVWLNTVYEEDIYVGYRYFESFPDADRRGYPFGHGLSYTDFSIECESCVYKDNALEVKANVTNTGSRPGREVVQLYISKPCGRLEQAEKLQEQAAKPGEQPEQAAKELVCFEKTELLAPGENQVIEMLVPINHMASYDEGRAAYVLLSGGYQVLLGKDVRHAEKVGCFAVQDLQVIKQVKNRMRANMDLRCLRQSDSAGTYPTGEYSGIVESAHCLSPERTEAETFTHTLLPNTGRKLTFTDVLKDDNLLPEFVGGMDVKTLARIAICASDGWGVEGRGEAGRLYRPEGLELPEFVVADGNSGVNLKTRNIGMPSGVTLCASFDKKLMEQVGRVIGEEAKELGIRLILAPALNLHRNPLNGRHPEYFSEDPYLAGSMAGWYCKGLESTGVGGCYKHLIANNAESGRKRNQSIITERAIRELYFRVFEYALEVHQPVSVMTAYNAVNGRFTSCDAELIQGLLFDECGFAGFAMTDWASYDSADVANMAMAGNSWITPGSMDETYTGRIEDAVADGRLPLARLQDNVLRLMRALVILNR